MKTRPKKYEIFFYACVQLHKLMVINIET